MQFTQWGHNFIILDISVIFSDWTTESPVGDRTLLLCFLHLYWKLSCGKKIIPFCTGGGWLSPNVDIFKSRLKTFLFSRVYAWICTVSYLDCGLLLLILIISFLSIYILLHICNAFSAPCWNAFILCQALWIVLYMKCAIQINLTLTFDLKTQING